MSLPLDPKPFYVIEADEQDLGPESDAGRYSYADGVAEDAYGRETTMAALARFLPRKGYEQERLRYREAYKRPGMTLAESLGIDVPDNAPGGQKMASLSSAQGQRSSKGRQSHNEMNVSGFGDYDALNSAWGED